MQGSAVSDVLGKSNVSLRVVSFRRDIPAPNSHIPTVIIQSRTYEDILAPSNRNRDGFLSFGEFKAALTSLQMEMAPGEMRALFGHLETEAVLCVGVGGGYTSGITSCQALVDAIRPPLSGERLGLVRLAFRKMDRRGEGRVSPETVAQR